LEILNPHSELQIVTWVLLKDPTKMTSEDILNLKHAGGVNNARCFTRPERFYTAEVALQGYLAHKKQPPS
jgi:hypothetical protein